jgi:hypothetical protein
MDLGLCQNVGTGMVRLRLLDNGERFDVALAADLAEEKAGDGNNRRLGLKLVKTFAKELLYRSLPDGGNELVLCIA